MTVEFKLPDVGEGIAEGEITKVLVSEGDYVKEDQSVVEVMTDKVTTEIPAPVSGTVTDIRVKEGEVIEVGAVLMVFDTDVSPGAAPDAQSGADQAADKPKKTAKQDGKKEQPAAATKPTASNGKPSPAASQPAPLPARASGAKVLAAPATRKLAQELGVDLNRIAGSGPRGRITPDDVRQGQGGASPQAAPAAVATRPQRAPVPTNGAAEKRVPFAGMRRQIAEHLVKSKRTAPHFAYVEEVDMSALVSVREQLRPLAEEQGVKLNYLPFIIKAVISGLKAFPALNATLDDEAQELIYKYHYHMGVAVATDNGLVVPVVKHAEQKTLLELATDIKALADKARLGRLSLDDIQGGTFTITSIGSIGGLFGVPIINHPEVAILGVNKISKRPVVRDDAVVIRDMMHLSISCDHRVVDGAECALFIKHVIEQLEAPARLLVDPQLSF